VARSLERSENKHDVAPSRRGRALAIFVACALAPGAVFAGANAAAAPTERGPVRRAPGDDWFGDDAQPRHATDRILVRFRTSTSSAQRAAAAAATDAHVVRTFRRVRGLAQIALRPGASVADAVRSFERRADVLYAEPDFTVSARATPNDTRFFQQWGLHNTGQTVEGTTGTPDADIDAPEAWNVTTGSSAVRVAVLDTGVAMDHPDLAPNVWANPGEVPDNAADDDGNGFVDDVHGWDFAGDDEDATDEHGHGTHVAGIIGARGNNDSAPLGPTDVTGVAWHVSIMPVRVLDATGFGSVSDIVAGIEYAAQNGARIVNMSLGRAGTPSQAEQDAIAAAPDVLFVVAAGNDSVNVDESPDYPCSYPLANIVCVTSSTPQDTLDPFTNFGSAVDIAAPGTTILSPYPFVHVVYDGIEEAPIGPRWTRGGSPNTWSRTTQLAATGIASLTDSPGTTYSANGDNWVRRGPFALSGYSTCRLAYTALIDTYPGDTLRVEHASATTGPWTVLRSWPGDPSTAYAIADDVGLPTTASSYFRFRLTTNGTQQADGVYIDDVLVQCRGTYDGNYFRFLQGTSMATPHVAGAAALVVSRFPAITTAQLRTRLLTTADDKGLEIGGGRLNAFRAVANSAPTASAGPDKTVAPGTPAVVLEGSAGDAEDDPISLAWVQTLGPPVALDDPHALQPRFTAPATPTTLEFSLAASTPNGPTVSDVVRVNVRTPK
jgi:subtilisin family serine protease